MQMKVGGIEFGVGIPKTNIGIGFFNAGKMFFRNSMGDNELVFKIGDLFSLGQKSGTFLAGGVQTDWFELEPKKDNWIFNYNWLIGKTAEIKITGLQVVRGQSDIEVIVIDKDNRPFELAKRCSLNSIGTQFSEIKIRGVIKNGTIDSRGRVVSRK